MKDFPVVDHLSRINISRDKRFIIMGKCSVDGLISSNCHNKWFLIPVYRYTCVVHIEGQRLSALFTIAFSSVSTS